MTDALKCFDIKEGIVGDETYDKMFETEKKELDVVVKDLEEWMSSNIKYQEVDQVLDNQFETKHRRLHLPGLRWLWCSSETSRSATKRDSTRQSKIRGRA